MSGKTELEAVAELQRTKALYQRHVKGNYEHAAEDCRTCPSQGSCCTDAHFVNVHITRLEAVAIRQTLEQTPRLSDSERRAVYTRARNAVERYELRVGAKDSFAQTYSCPLFVPKVGCLVHRRAKPAPCIQHACYENWQDLPPLNLQTRAEHRIEQLNHEVYGTEWAWLPTPLWLSLVDPESDGAELARMLREWSARPHKTASNTLHKKQQLSLLSQRRRRVLPVIAPRR